MMSMVSFSQQCLHGHGEELWPVPTLKICQWVDTASTACQGTYLNRTHDMITLEFLV